MPELEQEIYQSKIYEEKKGVLLSQIDSLKGDLEDFKHKGLIGILDAIEFFSNHISRPIVTSGLGKSGIIAQKAAATLKSYGFHASFLHPVEALHGDIGSLQKGAVAFLYSNSGNTSELISCIPHLTSRNCDVISFLGNVRSKIGQLSDVVIDCSVGREICPNNLAPTNSTTLALVASDLIAVNLAMKFKLGKSDFARNHPSGTLGKKLLMTVEQLSQDATTVNPTAEFMTVLASISQSSCGCVVIVDHENILGVITDGDIRRSVETHKTEVFKMVAANLGSKCPITVRNTSLAIDALKLMEYAKKPVNVLPVVNDRNKLSGIVRIHNIIQEGIG